jgi:beta-galactosidase
MNHYHYLCVACFYSACVFAERTTQTFNADWRFRLDPEAKLTASASDGDNAAWAPVTLPHDWAISGPFDPKADGSTGKLPWRGVGWYRKTFALAAADAGTRVYLDFDGVMASPEVFINGQKAGGWDYGYMGFRVDATPFVAFGKDNVVAVKADTRDHHSRWYPGAGIYRKVTLTVCAPVHVVHQATVVTTPAVRAVRAEVRVATAVTNALEAPAEVSVTLSLLSPSGKTAAKTKLSATVPAHGSTPLDHTFALEQPQLWDIDSPNLYQARVAVTSKKLADSETVRFGIRSFSFPSDDGFYLNGRRVQLKGVDLHADLGPLGMAFNRSAMRRQFEIMKDMGFNALRTSHNCAAPDLLDLCDEMGIFVWNECFDKWEGTSGRRNDQNLEEYVTRNLRQFALRDRNHPSVFVWSIGNEIPPAKPDDPKDPGMTEPRCTLFRSAIRAFDTTRPVGIGCCHGNAVGMGIFEHLDITGWNYGGQYAAIKAKYPDKPVLYSESASALSSYGYYANPPPQNKTDYAVDDLEVCSYDHNAAPWSDIPDLEFARMARDRYCGGEFVWTGIDYLGEPTPYMHYFEQMRKYPQEQMARSSYFGIADLCAIPKDRYFLYRSLWNTNSVTVHILPHWNWPGKEGKNVPVYVYTSGDSAELFLNGKSLGRRAKGQAQDKPANLAAGKAVSASSAEKTAAHDNPASAALDGAIDTRWCASGPDKPQWWQVDLGASTAFRYISLTLENEPKGYGYEILVSDDGTAWRTLFVKKSGEAAPTILDKPATARYVRVAFDGLEKGRWASIREFALTTEPPANPYYDVCDTYRLRWMKVAYQPGELKAVAYKNGQKIGESVMRTADKAVAVQLTPEHSAVPADGESVVFVQVDVVDAHGTRDPLAKNLIHFALTGPGRIVAVGNGNPRATDSFADVSKHPLYFGKAVAVIRRNVGQSGKITLTATADGLSPASATLK